MYEPERAPPSIRTGTYRLAGLFDPELVHLQLEDAASDPDRAGRLGLIPPVCGERLSKDVGLESIDGLFESALALAPLFAERLCLREHRVTFVLWEQPGPLALHDEDAAIPAATSEGRARFKARDFASRRARTARPARPPAPTARTARTPGRRPAVALP